MSATVTPLHGPDFEATAAARQSLEKVCRANKKGPDDVALGAGRAEAEEIFAEHERAKAARLEAWERRYREQEAARRRLAEQGKVERASLRRGVRG